MKSPFVFGEPIVLSIYELKPGFQRLLRPLVAWLYRNGVTANQVTLSACFLSLALGIFLCLPETPRAWFAAIPAWMFIRMAMNAVDGMLAREFGQKSHLGGYLNELTDVVSDAALYLPFSLIAPFSAWWVGGVIFLALLSEFAGVVGAALGASRRYDGPMGKSDRAFVFGALGLGVGVTSTLPAWLQWLMPLLAVALALTIFKRIRAGLNELTPKT